MGGKWCWSPRYLSSDLQDLPVCLLRILYVAGAPVFTGSWREFLIKYEYYAGWRSFRGEETYRCNGLQCQCAEYCHCIVPGSWRGDCYFGLAVYFCFAHFGHSLGIWVMRGLKDPELKNKAKLRSYFGRVWLAINQRTVWGFSLSALFCSLFFMVPTLHTFR